MIYTRVESKKLVAAIARASAALSEADDAVSDLLVLLTPAERSELPKPKDGFIAAAREAAHAAELRPIADITDYDADAVLEDLSNVEALDRLRAPVARLQQRLDDSRLLWLGEAYAMTLELYGVARSRAKKDAAVANAIEGLVAFFATPRLKKP